MFGLLEGAPSASAAYQYEYNLLITINGTGTIAAPNGHVSFSVSAKNDSGVTTGSCTVSEARTKTKIKCLDVTSLICCANTPGGTEAVLSGDATMNGIPTTYVISVIDDGSPGVGNDLFSIVTASGYARHGLLTDGNISIHIQS